MEAQKKILRGLVTATPTAITVQQLAIEYRNTIGEPIPYQKFGYNSLEHFFRSIPDTIQIQGYGPFALVNPVVSNKSSHVMALVSKQKIEVKRGRHRMPLMRRHVVVTTDFLKNSIPNPRPQPQKMYYPPANTKTMTSSQTTTISNIKNSSSDSQVVSDSSCPLSGNSVENKRPTSFVSSKNAVVEKPPVSYKSNNADHKVKQFTATKLRNSHSSSKLPEKDYDCIPSRRNNIFDKQTNSSITTESNNNIPMEDSEESVPVSVKNNLKNLIGQYPDGIWCADVPGVYRKMFKRELKYQDLGFRNLIDLCMYLKSTFHYVRPSNEDFKLFDRSKPIPASAEKYFTAASFSSKSNLLQETVDALPSLNWSDMESFLPPNVFKPGNEIPRTFVPDDTKENDTIDIVVGEIFDVSKFWVYKDDGKLDKLMDDIQVFYKENENEYKMPQDLIREGMYCVAIIIGEYHRALIIDSTSLTDDSTRVFFIDYGTMAKVKSQLYFLHEQFAQLPAQTIRCRLANICPPVKGAPWSQESSKEFRRIIKKRDLTAKISRVDWKDQYLEVFLADVTESQNVFYINNVLVEKGFAIFPDQVSVNGVKKPIVNKKQALLNIIARNKTKQIEN
ncbi:unnamed protein product [Psylliodes chrysocephalus]|uniref:Tudor domain-containing protein 7 n=1 Tax=Psylliodes chrysocephalus TaxID=3402493 RepID=A0A9P0CWY5_9CUCU|nr:unnamed protein product [Psylliodes chrysocephala]